MLSPEDKQARKSGMGGTDVADLLEGRAIDVYRRKVEGFEIPDGPALRRGTVLEPAVLTLYGLETGAEVLPGGLVRHPKNDIFLGNLDGRAIRDGAERVLEVKTASRHNLHQWGDGDDEIPIRALLQVNWYAGLTGLPIIDVAALLGGELKVYTIRADPELFGMMAQTAERFWVDHVATSRPPPPDASEQYGVWLAEKFPEHRAPALRADAELEKWAHGLRLAREAKAKAEEAEQLARNHLMAAMGEAEGLLGDGWRISWKQTKGREVTNWAALCAEVGVPAETISRHTARAKSFRNFRPTFKGADNE